MMEFVTQSRRARRGGSLVLRDRCVSASLRRCVAASLREEKTCYTLVKVFRNFEVIVADSRAVESFPMGAD